MRIQIIQTIIDKIRRKKKVNENIPILIEQAYSNCQHTLKMLKEKVKNNQKINIVFYVIYDSVFPTEKVFLNCLNDSLFNPMIVIIPDTSRGDDNMIYQMNKTYKTLSSKYKNVYKSYDEKIQTFKDFTKKTDMAFFSNPYDFMTHKFYSVHYNVMCDVLPLYASYGAMPDYYSVDHIINLPSLNMCWRVFADTAENELDFKEQTFSRGRNVILTGYCKMDGLADVLVKKRQRKKIIIAPHHTVSMPNFPLSNFLIYADLFLSLPERYPNIDFVFRPHPLLIVTLSKDKRWGTKKTKSYLNKMTSFPNVEYQEGGEYFDTFVNSDAMIHDCSSFLFEYLFTDHPVCYMLKSKEEINKIFAPLGINCLEQCYKAFNEQQIIDFIDTVVIKEKDPMFISRQKYTHTLKLNYPHVSQIIVQHIKEALI